MKKLFITTVLLLIFSSCENEVTQEEFNSLLELKKEEITKDDIVKYFRTKNIDVTFEKPIMKGKVIQSSKKHKVLSFNTLKEFEEFSIKVNDYALRTNNDEFTHEHPNNGGASEVDTKHYHNSTQVSSFPSFVHLNVSFLYNKRKPITDLSVYLTGYNYTFTYVETERYLESSNINNSDTYIIRYGTYGTIHSEVKIGGIPIFSSFPKYLASSFNCTFK